MSLERRGLVVAPNPFNRSAMVHWHLGREADVEVRVFDASGRAVRTLVSGRVKAGSHTALWNGMDDVGRKLSHGIYFVRLETPDNTVKMKTVLTR
jgi:flagellar hook assembly protein FlgD